jgi:hypothetical protein
MNVNWRQYEPTLEDILSDCIIKAVMKADGVDPHQLAAMGVVPTNVTLITGCWPRPQPLSLTASQPYKGAVGQDHVRRHGNKFCGIFLRENRIGRTKAKVDADVAADDPAQSVKTLFESRDASLGFWIGLNGSDHRSAARTPQAATPPHWRTQRDELAAPIKKTSGHGTLPSA